MNRMKCKACKGEGMTKGAATCPACKGEGTVDKPQPPSGAAQAEAIRFHISGVKVERMSREELEAELLANRKTLGALQYAIGLMATNEDMQHARRFLFWRFKYHLGETKSV